jgi:hypothetical protein
MTVGEIQANVLGVLRDAVMAHAAVVNNPDPLKGDPVRLQMEISRTSTAVTVAKACCMAAGLDENSIRFMVQAPFMGLTPERVDEAKRRVGCP